jgi:hypothetical protein
MIGANLTKAAAVPDVTNDGKVIEAYYDPGRKCYWIENSRGGWIEINETSLRRHLRSYGLRHKAGEGELQSEINQKLNEIQYTQDVVYAGPLAGHFTGLIDCAGNRVLVTSSPKLIKPIKGEWTILKLVIENLLADEKYDQAAYLHAWLKIADEMLRAGRWRQGQALALAGPRNCGKSLLQNLITLILGGRVAKPYRYMSGETNFNADLFGAEHLMIEDEHSSTDIRSRRKFGANIKKFTVNQMQSCHDKQRRAITLAPLWRLTISVNDEPEEMMVLPPMSASEKDSLGDKMFLLRARKAEMPMPTENDQQQAAFWEKLVSELPAYLYDLRELEIPSHLRCGRFGIKTWQHPELLAALDALAPETQLLGLVDEALFTDREEAINGCLNVRTVSQRDPWKGTAEALTTFLCTHSSFGYEARRLLNWPTACGAYLGRLASKRPDRVKKDRASDARGWIIFPPGGRGGG